MDSLIQFIVDNKPVFVSLTAILSLLIALFTLREKILKQFSGTKKAQGSTISTIKNVSHLPTQMHLMQEKVDGIQKELTPNGGSSIKDHINVIHEQVLRSEQVNRALADGLDFAILEFDKEGKCIWANQKWERMSGVSLVKSLGFGWINQLQLEERDSVASEWASSVEGQRDTTFPVTLFRASDETEQEVMLIASVIRSDKTQAYKGHVVRLREK